MKTFSGKWASYILASYSVSLYYPPQQSAIESITGIGQGQVQKLAG